MKNSSCLDINFDFKSKYLPPVLITVFIIGVVANGLGLKSLMHNWKKLGIVNVFVLNLGLADILYLLTLPFLMVYYRKNEWIFGEEFCKMTRFCFNLNLYGSIGFLTCISVYRYLAIVHTMRVMGKITVTHSVAISVMVWLLVTVQILPDMFYPKTTYKNNTMDCFDTTSKDYVEDYLNYSLGWTFTGFCIPFLITLGCYGHVIAVLCRTNTIDKVLKQRCLVLLFILILLFSVCYIPFHVLKNLNLCVPLPLVCSHHTRKCFDTTSKDYVEDYLYYSLGWTLTGFFIPLIITLGCYGHVIVVLCRRNTIDKVLKQRSLKLLLFMILLFCVCYIPYHILKNLNLTARVLQRQNVCRKWFNGVYIAYQISRGLVCLNSALNPLVYLHSMDDCLASLRKLLHGALEVFSQTPRTNSHSTLFLNTKVFSRFSQVTFATEECGCS
uniref:Si:dkey-78k11.9 n=1 Tax=Stegastes partitus TaxID=144197 RepID=A0A3B4ZAD6_9TELE